MAKSQTERTTAYRARRKARLAELAERFENGATLRICPADMWGIQEIKLILNPDAQEAGTELAAMHKVDVHDFMEEELRLNFLKLTKGKGK